ncbi:hypothetical protein MA6G0125S_5380 [Mycobacteroides abscessus 6G-0125-S]|nr:hypothetical protein MA6G0125S_5380 [Mycobacteroides abscessus 6G-0125-S]EIU64237.1 hypothetical protein MA6G0728S_5354 [Mycobacteroides abscessus 6G-0728-S]
MQSHRSSTPTSILSTIQQTTTGSNVEIRRIHVASRRRQLTTAVAHLTMLVELRAAPPSPEIPSDQAM